MADPRGAAIYSGKLYVAPYEQPGNLIPAGNVSSLEYTPEVEDLELKDSTSPGGGLDASVRRISAVEMSFDARHMNIGNMSRAVFGTSTKAESGTIATEAHMAYPGALVTLNHPGATDHVVKTTDSSPVTLEKDTDYIVTAAGNIQILEGAEIATETDITVGYSYAAYSKIEAMTATGKRFRFYFEGVNEVDGKPTTIDAYKVGLSPATLSMIGDDFASMPFTGKLEKDDKKSAAVGISQFMQILSTD